MFIEDDDKEKESADKSDDTQEDETSEKSEEEESAEDSTEDEEDEEEGEDISKKYFTDPNSVPKELRVAFKRMQGVYTRKMQAASLSTKKAAAFDQLVMDPEFRQWMEDKRAGVIKKSKSTKANEDSEDEDEDTPITRKSLQAAIAQALSPLVKNQQDDELRREANQFKKDNPDWKIYEEPMMELLSKHPTLSYQEAYDFASGGEAKQKSKKDSIEAKKRANLQKPGKVQGKEVEKKGKMTITDAYNLAKKTLGIK